MATEILGLMSSKKFADNGNRFYGHRRQILHSYPNGSAKLTGILSMLPSEPLDDTILNWYEKQYASPVVTTRGTNPATQAAPSTGDADDGTAIATGSKAITTDIFIKVTRTGNVRKGHVLRSKTSEAQFVVTAVTRGVSDETLLGYITVRALRVYTVANVATEFGAGNVFQIIGSATGEGQSGTGHGESGLKLPYAVMNTTQIHTDFFSFPGSVLQLGLKFDATGPYKERAHDTIVDHMTGLERSLICGKRSTTLAASYDSGQESLTRRTSSGIVEFLELWDAGSTGLSIDGATFAPYSHKSASTSDTDDNKRIITNAAGTISYKTFLKWAERVGRYHTNKTNEKLVLCGSGALIALAEMIRLNTNMQVAVGVKAYGLDVTQIITPFGTFNFMTHPLFNEDVGGMSNWMLFLDIWSLRWRPLRNRDTRLLKNTQDNGDDFRRDGYRTEGLLEFHNPMNNMLVKNVVNYVES